MSKYIDFEDPKNRDTYVGRAADPGWVSRFDDLVRPGGRRVADVGCGGGIYTKAIALLGPKLVVGVDSSRLQLESAREYCRGVAHIAFLQTDAESMAAANDTFDSLVERALIHHLGSLDRNFREALRVLKSEGTLWLQDRTVEDVLLPPSHEHIRGFYIDFDPRLRATELERRRHEEEVTNALLKTGFSRVHSEKIHELRKVFETSDELRDEILTRRGRSLLHGLDDGQLRELADYVVSQITDWPVHERDTWTVWVADK